MQVWAVDHLSRAFRRGRGPERTIGSAGCISTWDVGGASTESIVQYDWYDDVDESGVGTIL